MKNILIFVLGLGFGLPLATSADAQTAPHSDKATLAQSRADPGEVICQRITVVGSRMIAKRFCMTRLQWQEQKSGDREYTEKLQISLQLRDGG